MASSILQRIYHRVPAARALMASAYGHYLQAWRYGGAFEERVAEATERERWSPERWRAWQQERLARLLHHAATKVPYYREHWQARRRRGDRSSWEELGNWPVLTKEALRSSPEAFLAEGVPRALLFRLQTSGSTGTPLTLYRDPAAMRAWYTLFEARWRRWYGVDLETRWAMIGGRMVVPPGQDAPPYWVWNQGMRQLYMSTYHIRPETIGDYLEAMRRHRVRYVYGYASSMGALALRVEEAGLEAPPLAVAISNAEPLLDHQREAIERVFGCPVHDTYGMSEAVAGASECAHGALHLWPDAGVTEVVGDDDLQPVPAGRVGTLLCTGLLNRAMPLVRYRVGDRLALAPDGGPCACGRSLPRIDRLEGRIEDRILTPDGRRVSRFGAVFHGVAVREVQLVQESQEEVRVLVVPAAGYGADDEAAMRQRLRDRLGPMAVAFEYRDEIPRRANGKFRSIVSRIAVDEPAPDFGAAVPASYAV